MSTCSLSHLDDDALIQGFDALVAQDRRTTAALLAHIAEIDARHLYLKFGYESMRSFCMGHLDLTEDAAAKRIQVARLAKELPALFPAIADGRLCLGTLRVLAPRLNAANVDDLVTAAAGRTVLQVESLIASRFPQAECLRLDDGISPQVVAPQGPEVIEHATWHVEPPAARKIRTKIQPVSEHRFKVEVGFSKATHDKLRRAQDLLAHAVPSGSVEEVLDRALDALIAKLEKRKFGKGARPGKPREPKRLRAIPAHVRLAVYERDAGRCAFVDERGRCGSTSKLEIDHVRPVARGGRSTLENLRLLCPPHNRYAAERAFGIEFMRARRRF